MENSMLWIVGGIALALGVAALFWVLRHRAGTGEAERPRHYDAPAVLQPGTGGRSSVIFGSSESGDDDSVDQTVPRSRLGGAGWRDGGGADLETTTDAYAARAGTWAEADADSDSVHDPVSDPHVTVGDPGGGPASGGEADARRGGHW